MFKKQLILFFGLCFAFIGLTMLGSCDSENIKPTEDLSQKVSLDGLPLGTRMLPSGESIPPPEPIGEPSPGGEVVPSLLKDLQGVIISRSTMYRAGQTFNEYLLFNPMSNLIYPGNVLVGNSIANGRYVPVMKQKVGEITWSSVDLIPIDPYQHFVETVLNPSFSDYNSTLASWRSSPQLPSGAITTYEITEVNSLKEFSAKLGLGFESENIKAGITFEGKKGDLKTHILVKYVQKLFSVSMDIPRRQILLDADVNSLDGVLPVYISDIFYGRMGYAMISTDHDYFELLAALQIMVPSFKFELESKYKEILDKSITQYVIIGGKSNDHGLFVSEGWEGFKKALAAPLISADAVPIAITLRYANDNSVARVMTSGEYPVTESYFVKDCDELSLSFRPVELTGNAGSKKNLFIWGKTKLNIPAEISETGKEYEYSLVSIPMNQYIRLDENKYGTFDNSSDIMVTLKRPTGMTMAEFLKTKVSFDSQYYNTNSAGTITGDDLGHRVVEVSIQDLLFNAIHGKYEISTRRNTYRAYSANVSFELFHDLGNIQEIPNTVGSVIDSKGAAHPYTVGSNPKEVFQTR